MPPKSRRSDSSDSKFLFVNHNATNFSRTRRDARLTHEKQSFVQRHNYARRQQLQESKQPAESTRPSYPNLELTATPAHPHTLDPIDPTILSFSFPSGISEDEVPATNLTIDPALLSFFEDPFQFRDEEPQAEESQNVQVPQLAYGTTPNPNLVVQGSTSVESIGLDRDPLQGRYLHPLFHGRDQTLELLAPPLIKYFSEALLPEKFFRDTMMVPLEKSRHAAALHSDLQSVMSDPAHLYSFLAACSQQMLGREGKMLFPFLSDEAAVRLPTFFKLRAVKAIRQHIQTAALTTALIADIHRIISFHYFSSQYEAARPHRQAMFALLRDVGGLKTYGDYHSEQMMLLDWMQALKTLGKPYLLPTWDPGRNAPEVRHLLDQLESTPDRLGSRLLEVIEVHGWSEFLVLAVTDLVEIVRLEQSLKQRTSYEPELCKWALLRHLAIGNRLLHIDASDDPKEEALRIAIVFWTALTRSPASGVRCASTSIRILRAKIEMSTATLGWQSELDLLLWIAVIGALTSNKIDDRTWFTVLAQMTSQEIGIDSADELETVIGTFLYGQELQHRHLRVLAMEMGLY